MPGTYAAQPPRIVHHIRVAWPVACTDTTNQSKLILKVQRPNPCRAHPAQVQADGRGMHIQYGPRLAKIPCPARQAACGLMSLLRHAHVRADAATAAGDTTAPRRQLPRLGPCIPAHASVSQKRDPHSEVTVGVVREGDAFEYWVTYKSMLVQ